MQMAVVMVVMLMIRNRTRTRPTSYSCDLSWSSFRLRLRRQRRRCSDLLFRVGVTMLAMPQFVKRALENLSSRSCGGIRISPNVSV